MTSSRRHLFALLGLVLPVAAFTASPAAAAFVEARRANQVAQPPHRLAQIVQIASFVDAQRLAPHDASRAEAYRELTATLLRAFASSSARSPARMRSGVGGQPPICRSTGTVVPAPPVMA